MRTAASAVLAVVGDGRSGDPLHERGDKRKVYDSEVAKVDPVLELTRLTRRARVSTRGLGRARVVFQPFQPISNRKPTERNVVSACFSHHRHEIHIFITLQQ